MKLSALLHGLDATVIRDGEVLGFGTLTTTRSGTLHYYADPRFKAQLAALSGQHSVVTTPALAEGIDPAFGLAVTPDPKTAFLRGYLDHAEVLEAAAPFANEISDRARIHPRASIGDHSIRIGPGSVIDANAVIKERVVIEAGVSIGPGTVIGASGLECASLDGRQFILPHHGGVLIRSGVSILANCCVARGIYGDDTVIGQDTVIDNLVHVAHNVVIGARCQILASAMIAGSCVIDDDVRIGPGAVLSNGLRVGAGARVTMGSVVARKLRAGEHVTGHFAVPHDRFLQQMRSAARPQRAHDPAGNAAQPEAGRAR